MSRISLDYHDVINEVLQLEQELEMQELTIDGIYFWKLVRQEIPLKILMDREKLSSIQLGSSYKINFFEIIKNSITKNPLFRKKTNTYIFENPRKVNYDGQMIDSYTHFFVEKLQGDYTVLESRYGRDISKSIWSTNTNTDFAIVAAKPISKLLKTSIPSHIQKKVKEIECKLNTKFNVSLDIEKLIFHFVNHFKSQEKIYNFLFRVKKPKEIVIVCSYGKEAIIAAAQKNNIRVIEFQHGVMGQQHLGYHFPNWGKVPYFPDEIMLFGSFWKDITQLPQNTITTINGYPYLNKKMGSIDPSIKEKKESIIFISQGTIGKSLTTIANELAQQLPEYNIIYKLHPGEFGRWKKDYPQLAEFNQLANTKVVENDMDLYQLFSTAKFLVGVGSTAIYEGIAFGIYPMVVKLPGHENMQQLITNYQIPLVNSTEEILNTIQNSEDLFEIDSDDFFEYSTKHIKGGRTDN